MDKNVGLNFKIYYFIKFIGQGVLYPFLVMLLASKGVSGPHRSAADDNPFEGWFCKHLRGISATCTASIIRFYFLAWY